MVEPTEGPVEVSELDVTERIVLHKYNGNPTQTQIDTGVALPVETVILEGGKIVEHIIH